jgi:hypothetical protein
MNHLGITSGGLLSSYYCSQRFEVFWEKNDGGNLDAALMLNAVGISDSIVNAKKKKNFEAQSQ